jgi:hypothetical protein
MQSTSSFVKVEKGSIILGGVLLFGILFVAYGYYQHSHIVLFVGLIVIVAGVLNGLFRFIIRGTSDT